MHKLTIASTKPISVNTINNHIPYLNHYSYHHLLAYLLILDSFCKSTLIIYFLL